MIIISFCFSIAEESTRERTHTVNKTEITESTRDILKVHLKYEYEFYNFVKKRFYTLYAKAQRILQDDHVMPTENKQ